MTIELTLCEFCGEAETQQVYPGTFGIEDMDPLPFYAANRIVNGHFAIVRCKKCGLVRSKYRDDYVTRASHYYHRSEDEGLKEIQNEVITFQRRAQELSRETIPGGSLLDIGCFTGRFPAEMTRNGWQAVGIDPSEWAASQARELAPWAQFYVTDVENAIFPASSFDVITFWDGLDHVNSPHEALQRLTSWLEPGGLLLLNLPDMTSLQARLLGSAWPSLLRQHLWYFTPLTIKKLLVEHGYELVAIQPTRSRYTLARAARRLKSTGGLTGLFGHLLDLPGVLGRLSFWFLPGEMLITARLKVLQ